MGPEVAGGSNPGSEGPHPYVGHILAGADVAVEAALDLHTARSVSDAPGFSCMGTR